jgi:hypothetical protein
MTAIPHDRMGPEYDPALNPVNRRPKRGRKSTDLPKIRLLSWLGAESLIWGAVIAHLVKWAVSFAYFATFQVRYLVGYGKGTWTVWYLKDWWDRLPVHIQNALNGIGWRVRWFSSQNEPLWWITWRHDIRDVTIAVVATIIVELMFAKPKYPVDDAPSWKVYVTSIPLAIGAALVPIAIVGVLAWKVPWLLQHGYAVPSGYGPWASEANGWIAAGTWITVLMGILGGIAAKRIIQRVADDIQWFIAERSAGKIRSNTGLSKLRGTRVIGTPAHRLRVRWLLENKPDLPARNPWLVRTLLGVGFFAGAFAIAGAWLNIWGPAAPH